MKLFITGGSGFIGRNLVESLGPHYDLLAPSSAELNLLDDAAVRQYLCTHHFDVVVHAATTRSNRRLGAPPDMLDCNCRMFFNLARNHGLFGKMIHFGSGAEYHRGGLPPRVSEDYFDTRVPSDPYGFSKYVCAKYIERSERILNLRLFGVFGKYEDYTVRFISNACARVATGRPILIRRNVAFDYMYIDDLAHIARWFIENEPKHKAYNVCRGKSFLLTELAQIIGEISSVNPVIKVKDTDLAPEYSGDNSLLLTSMGGYSFFSIKDAIAELYKWCVLRCDQFDPEQLRFDE